MGSWRIAFCLSSALLVGCEKAPALPSAPTPSASVRLPDGGPELLRGRAEELLTRFRDPKLEQLRPLFTEPFLKEVSAYDLRALLDRYVRMHGKPERVKVIKPLGPFSAEVEFAFARVRLPATLHVDSTPPHLISGLLFQPPQGDADSLASLLDEVKALSGAKGLLLRRLEPQPETLLDLNGDQPLAIGSTFKLFLLGCLCEEVAAGKRRWSDEVQLRSAWKSLPSGLLQDWPDGSPVTLHSLAGLMVSRSDNTAADHLLFTLGREQVEASLLNIGVKDPARNRPLLATSELFKLKLILPPATLAQYAQSDEAGKRRMLAEAVAPTPLKEPRILSQPSLIDRVEWFASPADLVRILDRLRDPKHDAARQLLAILPPYRFDEERWSFLGYKGGAEFGVLSYTLLLHSRRGPWYALAVTWNDPNQDVDASGLLSLTERFVRALQRREQAQAAK